MRDYLKESERLLGKIGPEAVAKLLPGGSGCELTVVLDLTARSETAIKPDALDLKVKETLRQIGA